MGRLLPLLFIADLALIAVAMVDCLGSEPHEVRALPRWLWVLVILLAAPLGPVAWLAIGRPTPIGGPRRPAGGTARRPSGPDDDPEFLRGLAGRRPRPEDEELLRRMEAEFGPPERPGPDRPPRPGGEGPERGGTGGQTRKGGGGTPDDSRRRHPSGKDIDDDLGGDPTGT